MLCRIDLAVRSFNEDSQYGCLIRLIPTLIVRWSAHLCFLRLSFPSCETSMRLKVTILATIHHASVLACIMELILYSLEDI